jgi:hypothetical protein
MSDKKIKSEQIKSLLQQLNTAIKEGQGLGLFIIDRYSELPPITLTIQERINY